MNVTLRAYQPADFEPLYRLDQACYPRGIAYSRRTLRWFLTQTGADCLVALSDSGADGVVAGFIVTESEGINAHIVTLDVDPAIRRARIGTSLLGAMEKRLAERGVSKVTLETAANNEAGVAFWQHHGYRAVGVLQRYYLNRLDAFFMRKNLA